MLVIAVAVTFPFLWWAIRQWLTIYRFHFYYGIWFWLMILVIMVLVIGSALAWKIREMIRINPADVLRNE